MGIGAVGGAIIGARSGKYVNRAAVAGGVGLIGLGIGAAAGGAVPIGKPLYEAAERPRPIASR